MADDMRASALRTTRSSSTEHLAATVLVVGSGVKLSLHRPMDTSCPARG
ncbi:hypothetical protein [Amycolatopsis sp. RTGN1]|nr:hypothetical protein [Amycolatopsis sp. RTGN1]